MYVSRLILSELRVVSRTRLIHINEKMNVFIIHSFMFALRERPQYKYWVSINNFVWFHWTCSRLFHRIASIFKFDARSRSQYYMSNLYIKRCSASCHTLKDCCSQLLQTHFRCMELVLTSSAVEGHRPLSSLSSEIKKVHWATLKSGEKSLTAFDFQNWILAEMNEIRG